MLDRKTLSSFLDKCAAAFMVWARRVPRSAYIVGGLLFLTLTAPFVLRPSQAGFVRNADKTLVIISPHNETIRAEFSRGFRDYMEKTRHLKVRIDWRVPGGTSEIERFLNSSYLAAFENHWKSELKRPWNDEIGAAVDNRLRNSEGNALQQEARQIFLDSNVGVGIDLLFGGGAYPFIVHSQAGHLVDSGIFERHPEWFSDEVIPARISGEIFYDPGHKWIGNCLSTFGICYNTDSLDRLGIGKPPTTWSDLADPRYFGQLALADPSKSGSVTKAFEMLIQQQIHREMGFRAEQGGEASPELVEKAVRLGWTAGLNMIQRICANARYFTDSSAEIPLDVTQGNAAAGMCIDFYGRTSNELTRKADGSSRVHYVTPIQGSSTSVDPIAMLRGAPEPGLALDFIEFVLSIEGQKLWNFRKGSEGGPAVSNLRRLPVRKDIYSPEHLAYFTDAEVMPYEIADEFQYVFEYTGAAFAPIRLIIKSACIDPHEEMRVAWKKLVKAGFPPRATKTFFDVSFVDYDKAHGFINETLRSGYRISHVKLAREISSQFRRNYKRAATLADQGI